MSSKSQSFFPFLIFFLKRNIYVNDNNKFSLLIWTLKFMSGSKIIYQDSWLSLWSLTLETEGDFLLFF